MDSKRWSLKEKSLCHIDAAEREHNYLNLAGKLIDRADWFRIILNQIFWNKSSVKSNYLTQSIAYLSVKNTFSFRIRD